MRKLFHLGLLLSVSGTTALWCDTVYTSSFDFETAVQNSAQQLEVFSTLTPGQSISNGQTIDGITYAKFNLTGGATAGYVTGLFSSFSGQSLGANHLSGGPNQQSFLGSEGVQLQFATPITAFGVLFNVNLNSGSYGFTAGSSTALTASTAYDENTFVFAGLVASAPFQSVTISSVGSQALYTIPALISVATPEPSSWTLSAAGALLLLVFLCRNFYTRLLSSTK